MLLKLIPSIQTYLKHIIHKLFTDLKTVKRMSFFVPKFRLFFEMRSGTSDLHFI